MFPDLWNFPGDGVFFRVCYTLTEMLLIYIFGPSVVKYDILSNNRRSKLHTVIGYLFAPILFSHEPNKQYLNSCFLTELNGEKKHCFRVILTRLHIRHSSLSNRRPRLLATARVLVNCLQHIFTFQVVLCFFGDSFQFIKEWKFVFQWLWIWRHWIWRWLIRGYCGKNFRWDEIA